MRAALKRCGFCALALAAGCSLFVNPDTDQLGTAGDGGITPDGRLPPVDAGHDSQPVTCEDNCDDGIACTRDECVGEPKACQHTPDHEACGGEMRCDPIRGGCTGACVNNDECRDNNPCNGIETCNQQSGECIGGDAVQCETRDTCWQGTCNPENGECDYVPNDALCGSDNLCQVGSCGRDGCTTEPIVCNDGSPCTRDFCDEAKGCQTELIDDDGDGQASDRLGACGTDCDDDDNRRYQGATEYCDGVDSNCNGRSDASDACVNIPDTCNAANNALPDFSTGQTMDVWNGPVDLLEDNYDPDCFGSNTGPDAAFEIRTTNQADVMVEATTTAGNANPKLMVVVANSCGPAAFDWDPNEMLCNEDATEQTETARIWVQDTRGFDLLLDTDNNDSGTVKVTVSVMAPRSQQCGSALDISAGGTWIGHPRDDQDYEPDCSSNRDNPQGIATFTGPADGTISAIALDDFGESVLELADGTCSNDIDCDSNGGANARSISANVTSGVQYHLVVEGDRTNGTFAVQFKP